MIIAGFFGDPKVGKTDQSQLFPEPIAIIDGEYPRAEAHWKKVRPDRLCTIFPARVVFKDTVKGQHKRGQLDVVNTAKVLEQSVDTVLDLLDNFETVVLDGASDIRSWVAAKWLYDFNRPLIAAKKTTRKSVGRDQHAWAEINDIVGDDIIFPLINACRDNNINFILTATMKDVYGLVTKPDGSKDSAPTGERIPDIKSWIGHELDELIVFTRRKDKYWVSIDSATKKHKDLDITDKSLFDELTAMGV